LIETVFVPATPRPTGFLWWIMTGDSWAAPAINNGSPYLPDSNWLIRNIFWWFRNPAGNFIGFVVGLEGHRRTVRGPAPVMLTTWRDARPPKTGWKWCVTNGWAPFVSYWGGKLEFYLGWRPDSGGLGFKFVMRESAYSDQPY
jgi:hypothetical protein